jgi:hypothetical protein
MEVNIYLPDTMSRATLNAAHQHVPSAWTNWYAVISRLKCAASDWNSGRCLHVNAISVGALVWCNCPYISDHNFLATVDNKVSWLTVDRRQAANQDVICPVECYRLHCKESNLMLRDKPLMNYGIGFILFFSQKCLCI